MLPFQMFAIVSRQGNSSESLSGWWTCKEPALLTAFIPGGLTTFPRALQKFISLACFRARDLMFVCPCTAWENGVWAPGVSFIAGAGKRASLVSVGICFIWFCLLALCSSRKVDKSTGRSQGLWLSFTSEQDCQGLLKLFALHIPYWSNGHDNACPLSPGAPRHGSTKFVRAFW